MSITALPTPPLPTDITSVFNSRAFALLSALPTFVTEANTLQTDVNATSAITSADRYQTGLDRAQTGLDVTLAQAAAATAGAVLWVTGSTYSVGALVYSPIDFLAYRRKVSGAGAIDPSFDNVNWAVQTFTVFGSSINLAQAQATALCF